MSKWKCSECGAGNPPDVSRAFSSGTAHMSLSIYKCNVCGNKWRYTSSS